MFKRLKNRVHYFKCAKDFTSAYPLITDMIKEQVDRLEFLRGLKKNGVVLY